MEASSSVSRSTLFKLEKSLKNCLNSQKYSSLLQKSENLPTIAVKRKHEEVEDPLALEKSTKQHLVIRPTQEAAHHSIQYTANVYADSEHELV